MKINYVLSDEELEQMQEKLYKYFETGYDFEEFLREYFLEIGLDEVQITQRAKDGGIDLIAVRKGIGDFSEADSTNYYIQAKRHGKNNKINVSTIRQLKGTIPFGHKGILVTTSDFTKDAVSEAVNDTSKPVTLINGVNLITSLIENEIGFVFKPSFSSEQLDKFLNKKDNKKFDANKIDKAQNTIDYIDKLITKNDIRSRIVSIPTTIMKQFTDDMQTMDVVVNDTYSYCFKIVRGRNYFGGVTNMLKEFNMISNDGVITAKQSKWYYNIDDKKVYINIEDYND